MKHHDLSTLAAKVAKEHLITNNMNLLSDIPRLGFEAPCKLALDQTVFRSRRWQNIIPVKFVKVSGLKHLVSIYPGVFREHDHVTTAKVKNGGWQVSYPEILLFKESLQVRAHCSRIHFPSKPCALERLVGDIEIPRT